MWKIGGNNSYKLSVKRHIIINTTAKEEMATAKEEVADKCLSCSYGDTFSIFWKRKDPLK